MEDIIDYNFFRQLHKEGEIKLIVFDEEAPHMEEQSSKYKTCSECGGLTVATSPHVRGCSKAPKRVKESKGKY